MTVPEKWMMVSLGLEQHTPSIILLRKDTALKITAGEALHVMGIYTSPSFDQTVGSKEISQGPGLSRRTKFFSSLPSRKVPESKSDQSCMLGGARRAGSAEPLGSRLWLDQCSLLVGGALTNHWSENSNRM